MDAGYIELFWEHAADRGLSGGTARAYLVGVSDYAESLSSRGAVLPGSREDASEWLGSVTARVSPATARVYLAAVRSFCSWLARRMGVADPASGLSVPHPKAERQRKPALPPAKAAAVLARLESLAVDEAGMRDLALVRCVMLCCVRKGEACAASAGDLSTGSGRHVLACSGQPVLLDPATGSAIGAYLSLRRAEPGDPLFASASDRNRGGRLTIRTVSRILSGALECVGETSGSVSFAKTAVEMALERGASEQEVREFARMRGLDVAVEGVLGVGERAGAVHRAVAECLGSVPVAGATAGDVRRMLYGLPDDAPVSVAVAPDGSFAIAAAT